MDDNQLKYTDLKAEFYLSTHYPELQNPIVVKSGQFYQNFTNDCMSVDEENRVVQLSRDGIFRFLPENLFFNEQSLTQNYHNGISVKQRSLIQQEEYNNLNTLFTPFDTRFFDTEMRIEKAINHAETDSVAILLKSLFNYDLSAERDPFIRKLAPFRLNASTIKGNLPILCYILKNIIHHDAHIETVYRTYKNRLRLPTIVITILIDNLTAIQYNKKMEQYENFINQFAEWFLPFECDYEYAIKDKTQPFILGQNLILDYSTQL